MSSKIIRKITTVVLLISLFAIQFPSHAFAAVNGDRKTDSIAYTYSQIKSRRDTLKIAKDKYDMSIISNSNTKLGIAFGYLAAKLPKVSWLGKASGISLVATSALEFDKVMGVQRSYSDLCDVYAMFDNTKDYMETHQYGVVTIKQKYEFKVTRIFGDHTAEWYLDGNPYVSSYSK
ncbi:hypothetical protein [Clostridium sp.]